MATSWCCKRTAWLDFSGDGYTVVDSIGGQMRQGWRLEMGPPYALQSARKFSGEALLVTSGTEHGFAGLEVRDREVAVSRGLAPAAYRRCDCRRPGGTSA